MHPIKLLFIIMKNHSQTEDEHQFPFEEDAIKQIYPQYSHSQLKRLLKDSVFDYSLGCILGSGLGDALGSYCQFQTELDQNKMYQVMKMPGGGTFRTKPGQLTDDTQLSLHLLQGILKTYDPKYHLQTQLNKIVLTIAGQYVQWKNSYPFDIGNTCSSAFNSIQSLGVDGFTQQNILKDQVKSKKKVEDIMHKVMMANSQSQSNGSLMRIAPMAVFLAFRKHQRAVKKVRQNQSNFEQFLMRRQVHLSHCNQAVVDSSVVWVNLLQNLILRKQSIKQLLSIHDRSLAESPKSIQQWVRQSKRTQLVKGYPNIGWAKIAFCMGYNILRSVNQTTKKQNKAFLNEQIYKMNIQRVIKRGGDTDTNAAIVGGMLGAIVGYRQLPKEYLRKMMAVRFKQSPHYFQRKILLERGLFYEPRQMLVKCIKLYKKIMNNDSI